MRRLILGALALVVIGISGARPAEAGPALDRIVTERTLRLGFRTDAPPFSSQEGDRAMGFTVELCVEVAKRMGAHLGIEGFEGRLIAVDTTDRFDAIERGDIDILCGATTATLSRRERVAFSLPFFATGVGAAVASDAPDLLREVLIEGGPASVSDAAIEAALTGRTLGVRSGTTAADWIAETGIGAIEGVTISETADHKEGIAKVRSGAFDAYFADQAILAGLVRAGGAAEEVSISARSFTHEPYALALPKGDAELRLEIDRALSELYRSGAVLRLYERHFGAPTAQALLFYAMTALPE